MSRACRIFRLQGCSNVKELVSKLDNAASEHDQIVPGTKVSVKLRVTTEKLLFFEAEEFATGSFVYDEPIVINRRDDPPSVDIQSLVARFGVVGERPHLVVFSNQNNSTYVRARTTPIFAQKAMRATSVTIDADRINAFLYGHPNVQRNCSWVSLTLPHVTKVRLGGFDINHTPDYARYEQHGKKNSVMFTMRTREGWTVTMNTQGAVTIWNDVEETSALRFIRDDVLQLCTSVTQQSLAASLD